MGGGTGDRSFSVGSCRSPDFTICIPTRRQEVPRHGRSARRSRSRRVSITPRPIRHDSRAPRPDRIHRKQGQLRTTGTRCRGSMVSRIHRCYRRWRSYASIQTKVITNTGLCSRRSLPQESRSTRPEPRSRRMTRYSPNSVTRDSSGGIPASSPDRFVVLHKLSTPATGLSFALGFRRFFDCPFHVAQESDVAPVVGGPSVTPLRPRP